METVLNEAERKFVRMSWEVAKAKRSNESINSTSHSHSLPPFFFEKCQSPSHIHRHKTLWKSWGKHKRAKRGRKCSGSLYIESSAGSTWFREMKRGFLALPCCSFSTFSLGFAYYIKGKKNALIQDTNTERQADGSQGVSAWWSAYSSRFRTDLGLSSITITAMVGGLECATGRK